MKWMALLLALCTPACLQEGTGAEIIGSADAGDEADAASGGEDIVDAAAAADEGVDQPAEVGGSELPQDAAPELDQSAPVDVVEEAAPDAPDVSETSDVGGDAAGSNCEVPGRGQGECLDTADCVGDRSPTPGYCPDTPANIQCCTPVPAGECDPEATPQPNADLTEEAPGAGDCPDGMAPVAGFCVDRFEASLVEVLANGDEVPWSPYFNPGTHRVRAVSVEGAVPQGYITGLQAADACEEAGKRLCTDTEWLRACNHAAAWDYPYGTDKIDGYCNEDRADHPAHEYFGTWADWIWSELDHPCLNQLPNSLAPAGAYAECVSPEGIYDLVGNLHEWTADPNGTFRGGFYVDTWRNGIGCAYDTTAHDTGHWDYSTGFRCCADPE